MLKYELINKEWLVSARAYFVYRLSAALSIALFAVWWALIFEGGLPPRIAAIGRPLVFLGVIGAGITFVGMEFFLFRFDDSHPLKQIAWFCVMMFPLLGPALYCFLVYSKSKAVRNSLDKDAMGIAHG